MKNEYGRGSRWLPSGNGYTGNLAAPRRPSTGLWQPKRIDLGTWIKNGDPANHSGDAHLRALSYEPGGADKLVALAFPEALLPAGTLLVLPWIDTNITLVDWIPCTGVAPPPILFNGDVEVRTKLSVRPITNWGGLNVTTLRWSNKGSLTLGAEMGPFDGLEFLHTYNVSDPAGGQAFSIHSDMTSPDLRLPLSGVDPILGLLIEALITYVSPGLTYNHAFVEVDFDRTGDAWVMPYFI